MIHRHKLTVYVSAIGARVAYDVRFREQGCGVVGSTRFKGKSQMTSGTEPVELKVLMPEADEDTPALLEVLWLHYRPHRHLGQRYNLRTSGIDDWRWCWRSLRIRGRRLVRTRGRWVARGSRDCPSIPETRGASR